MKKNILFAILLAGLVLTQTACDDNKDEFLDDFSTILYFLNSGEQNQILYRTGENTTIAATVNKAGSNLDVATNAKVTLLDESQLAIYNAENFTSYKLLPSDCYEIAATTSIEFGKKDLFKNLDILFKTNEINDLGDFGEYALPLGLSSPDSVNSQKSVVLYIPEVIIPTVYFTKTGYTRNDFEEGGETSMKFTLPVTLPMENRWAFDCTVGVDESLLTEYNTENELSYSLLPTSAYTLSGDGIVSFTEQDDIQSVDITVSNETLDYGNYVLPLRLLDCSKEAFMIDPDNSTCLFGISYVPQADKLNSIALTASQLSSNAIQPTEGSLAALLDGDVNTYFHSIWSESYQIPDQHYLQVELDEEITAFTFSYTTRATGGSSNPASIILSGSTDNENFYTIDRITEGLVEGGAETYNSPIFVCRPTKYLRFTVPVNKTGSKWFVWSEFSMKGL